MFGMGGAEMLVIGIVALIVVGPKDLPMLFRNVGQFVGKARGMAREFQFAMNKAVDESGVNDISKTLKTASNPIGSAFDSVKEAATDATNDINKNLNIDPDSETGKLAAKRAEQTKKIQASTARAAATRKADEAAAALAKADEAEAALNTPPKSDT
ncbi:MAG: sec-independent protein translocase protein TatB [Candidatus Azotimanducaceae bacterium]|jgi:sec-independent protein translocase protein TatB|tara:strand:+ start:3673 stop:4140 length:468 start_codon:yes stop_codon:yes gene_type:complete